MIDITFLFISVLCRAASLVLCIVMGIRLRNWRMGFFALLFGVLSYRKFERFITTLREAHGGALRFDPSELRDALESSFTSVLMLLATIFLAKLFRQLDREKTALQRSEEFNRRLVEALPGGILQVDPAGLAEHHNPEAVRMLDLKPDAAGRCRVDDIAQFALNEDGSGCPLEQHPLKRCLATGQAQAPVTLGTRLGNGEATWAVFRAVPLLDPGGRRVTGAVLTLLDVTRRKRAEALIQGRSRVLELIAEGKELKEVLAVLAGTVEEQIPGSLVSVLLLNQTGTHLYVCAAPRLPSEFRALEDGVLVGPGMGTNGCAAYTRQRVVDEDIAASNRWSECSRGALEHGVRACWSEPIFASNSELLGTLAIYFLTVRSPDEEELQLLEAATHVAGIAIERRRTEEALRQSEASLARTEAFALVIPTQINLDGSWRKLTPTLCDLVAYPETQLSRVRFLELIHPDDQPMVRSLTERLLSGELRTIDTEARLLRKDGFLVWVYLNASLVSDDRGRPVCFLTYIQDVTERKRAEQALRDSEQRLKLAMRAADLGSWDWDIQRNRILWSEETEAMFGLSPRSFAGTFEAVLSVVHPEDRALVVSRVDQALEDLTEIRLEHRVFSQSGEIRWVEVTGKTLTDKKGEPVRMLGTALDITERKKAALELEQARESLRSLSHELLQVQENERRQIAHELHGEVGHALAIIKTNLQAVSRSLDAAPHLSRLRESIAQADHILQQVHDLSLTLRPPLLDDMGLEAALRWYVDQQTLQGSLQPRIVVENVDSRLDSEVETACFRVAQEAINNVVRHARASKLTVELRRSGGHLHLVVRDNGCGFDVMSARRQTGHKKSMGLLGMEERAAAAGGRLECLSRPTQGTEINAWFPLDARPHPPHSSQRMESADEI